MNNHAHPVFSRLLDVVAGNTLTEAEYAARSEEELREQYAEYRENCARDLTAIEIEYGGIISFREWREARINAED